MKTVVAETWGLCDFRRIGKEAKSPDEPFVGFWGKEVDPGTDTEIGDWWSLQDGMVIGPYKSRRLARQALMESRAEDYADDPGRVGRLTKVVRRYKGGGSVTLAAFSV